ncbi:MAG: sigma-70 factor domain-containing protein [Faecalibacillus sp.]
MKIYLKEIGKIPLLS